MSSDEDKVKQRAVLRERFLNVCKWLEHKPLDVQMYQGASVQGTFRSLDYDISNIHVSNLQTPIGIVPEALLRVSDICKIKIALDN